MVTDYASIETAIDAIRIGAYDYISKTPNLKQLKLIIEKSLKERLLRFQNRTLVNDAEKPYHNMIGESPAMQEVKAKIKLFANNDNTVLITGESGVGKELVARQIHIQSKRSDKPFVAINCAAIPKDLLESELFGHEKGAFTGAINRKLGKFEIASDGTIFLDEISQMEISAQVKLLRVLQEREFERIGGNRTIKTSARIIAATNQSLLRLTEEGNFREDLYYRLDVLPIEVKPLRERKEDIPLLIEHFLIQACEELKIPTKRIAKESREKFQNYNWPGNIRELQNYVTRAVILSTGEEVSVDNFDSRTSNLIEVNDSVKVPETWEEMDILRKEAADKASREVEKLFLINVLKKNDGNITKAAESIRINRSNFHKMMRKCGVGHV
jgi:two-component system nitrogen regulation response regulator NtrX